MASSPHQMTAKAQKLLPETPAGRPASSLSACLSAHAGTFGRKGWEAPSRRLWHSEGKFIG